MLILTFSSNVNIKNSGRTISLYEKQNFEQIIQPKNIEQANILSESFGDQRLFWIQLPEFIQIRATCLAVGDDCYIYMANETIELLGENNSLSKCEALRDAFDHYIYPKAIEVAGHPSGVLGDIDGDPKVTVFLAPTVRYMGQAYLGFINLDNENPSFPYANLREMVYVDSEHNVNDTICITIHEFNHLIWYNNDWNDCQFINEGLANYAVDYAGYDFWVTTAVVTSFTYHPEISLLHFVREYGELWDSSYGQAYLFVTYLANRFGNEFTKKLVFIEEDGAIGVDAALEHFGYNLTFNDLYLDWITACVLDNTEIYDGIYGFETVDYRIQAASSMVREFIMERRHYYYGFDVKKIYTSNDNFTFVIDNPQPYALGISIAFEDDNGWTVIQEINEKKSDDIRIYVEGENIRDVYIITSLLSKNTPTVFGTVMSLNELISVDLNYTFYDGNHVTDGVGISYSYFIIIPVVMCMIIFKKKRS